MTNVNEDKINILAELDAWLGRDIAFDWRLWLPATQNGQIVTLFT